MAEANIIKKISPREVMELTRGAKLELPKSQTPLFVVYGAANGLLPKKTPYGEEFAICGRFEAVRATDHKTFTSEQLYLPGDYHGRIVQMLKANPDTGLIPEVTIAFNVGYKPSADSPTGYTFVCSPVLDASTQDALANARAQVLPKLANLLPAPKAEAPAAKK